MATTEPLSRKTVRRQVKRLLHDTVTVTGTALAPVITPSPSPAGDNVFTGRDIPLGAHKLPAYLVYSHRDKSESHQEGGAPQFNSIYTVIVEARAEDADPERLEDILDDMIDLAMTTVLCNAPFVSQFAWVNGFTLEFDYKSDGKVHQGRAFCGLDFAWTYSFPLVVTQPLTEIALEVDAGNVFDPSGTYTPPFPYTPVPAPRDHGPDGRVEIAADIVLPQE